MGKPNSKAEARHVTFLPEDYVARKAEARANFICLSLFGIVMFGVVAAFFVTNRQWLGVRAEQQLINTQYADQAQRIEQLKALEAQKAEMMAKAQITTALLERVPRSILLAELVTRMPTEITLLELNLDSKRLPDATPEDPKAAPGKGPAKSKAASLSKAGPKGAAKGAKPDEAAKAPAAPPKFDHTLKLVGVARVNNDIADYLASLKSCDLLEAVELTYIKSKTLKETEFREFEITARIRPDADARSLESVAELRQGSKAIDGDQGGGLSAAPEPADAGGDR